MFLATVVTPGPNFMALLTAEFWLGLRRQSSIEDRNIEHTYVQVHKSPSREFVCFEKRFLIAFFRQCRPGVLLLRAAK